MSIKRLGIWGVVLLCCGGAASWWSVHKKEAGKPTMDRNRPVPVLTEAVSVQSMPVLITALGTVTPTQQVTVRPRVDGLLQLVHFTEGARVHGGSPLAQIDPRPFTAALATAQGQLAKDQAQLEIAQTDLLRYRKLLAQDSIARQEVETQESLVKQLQGTVAADKGTVATAELNLSFTTITAPVTGVAGLRQIDPGNMVHASDSTGLVVLTAIQPIDVVFTVPEELMAPVFQQRQTAAWPLVVEVYGRNQSQLLAKGTLLAIDNQTDPTTGSTKLKARFANTEGQLFPGQFVNVRLIVTTLQAVPTVTQSAIQRTNTTTFVYLVNPDQSVAIRPVQLGPGYQERVAVVQGLAAGETVVIDGADKLREGGKITPLDNGPEAGRGRETTSGQRRAPASPAPTAPSPPVPPAR